MQILPLPALISEPVTERLASGAEVDAAVLDEDSLDGAAENERRGSYEFRRS